MSFRLDGVGLTHANGFTALADITLAAHQKAADYTVTKTRFALIELALGAAVFTALGWGFWCWEMRASGRAPRVPREPAALEPTEL